MKGSENRSGDYLGGYATSTFEYLEDLAEDLAKASSVDRDAAITRYCNALHTTAATRANARRREQAVDHSS